MGNSESMAKFEDLELERSKGEVHEDWNIIPGTLRGYDVTVFSSVHPQSSRKRPYIEKALQASKVYRHPGILKYMDGGLLGNEIIVITEEATPLLTHGIENMSFLQITAGLASIVEALAFLHDKAGVSHNNVCASSIYVTSEGLWKLWGLEYSCSFGDLTRDHIEKINQYCNEKSIPPDDKNRISPAYQHARDSFFFGKFIDEVIAPSMNIDDHMIEEFVRFVKLKSLHNDWAERPRFSSLLEHSVFQHEFLKLRKNLNNILILPMEERNEFIRSLPKMLKNYSEEVISSTFASVLLSHSFLLVPSSSTHLMPILLTPKSAESEFGLFSAKVFKETVVPLILHLFSIHDATIRKILLTHFEHYAPLIEKNQLAKFVLPQLLLGIRDTDEELVSKTLQALGYLIPIVGANVVTGVNREQIFATATPKTAASIRTVGKIRNKKALELQLASSKQKSADVSCNVHIVQEAPSSDFLSVMNNSEFEAAPSLDIPERSSPDGGENIDIDKLNLVKEDKNDELMNGASDDQWSDWEEMLDQPTPEIVGILQVKSPDGDNTYFGESNVNCSSVVSSQEASNKNSLSRNVISKDKVLQKGSAMHLKSQIEAKVGKSHGLGEEYDIKCLEIDKKPDAERDLFAELTPNLLTKGYNLETMLLEASQKARPKLPSLSNTLAELNEADIEEGDEWNTENVFSSSEETNSPDIDGKDSPLESSLRT